MLDLSKDDIKYLREQCETNDIEICQICRAFDKTEFEIWDYKNDLEHKNEPIITKIKRIEVLKTIDKNIIIDGMSRCVFHNTATRDIGNNKLLYFNSNKFLNKEENIDKADKENALLFKNLFNREYDPDMWSKTR